MTGSFKHTIDAKGRLFIPAKLRDELGECFYVTKGLDECLSLYPEETWKRIEAEVSSLPVSQSRDFQRMFFASASMCETDAQGRIVVPQVLRTYAGLEKDVTIIGVSSRAEIWNADKWDVEMNKMSAESLAEAMDKLGI